MLDTERLRWGTRFWAARELFAGERELRLLPRLLATGGTFVDIGANIGVYSLVAARFATAVVAYEPHPAVARQLRTVLGPRATVRQAALSDATGTERLFVPGPEDGQLTTRGSLDPGHLGDGDLQVHEVTVGVLDDEGLDEVRLVKIDVEGHEMSVLKGARKLLARCRPAVLVEAEERHHPGTVAEIGTFFGALGYRGAFALGGRLRPFEDFSAERFQRPESVPAYGHPAGPDYVNNFLWVPSERAAELTDLGRDAAQSGARALLAVLRGRG